MTTGRRGHPDLGATDPRVHVEAWVDQQQVLPHAAAVVCHGGSGTVFGVLAAGVPVVGVPLFADQPANLRRVAAAGAGLTVDRGPHSAAVDLRLDGGERAALRAAAQSVLGTPRYRQAARAIAAEQERAQSIAGVLAELPGRAH